MKKGTINIPETTTRGSVSVKDRLQSLDKTERYAVLATDSDGQPYTSLIAYALTEDLKGVVFATPKNTSKHKNILMNPHVSVLIDSRADSGGDYLSTESVTIIGTARPLRKGRKWSELLSVFVKKHPQLSSFVKSSTTAIVFIDAIHYVHVDRFQSITEWHVK